MKDDCGLVKLKITLAASLVLLIAGGLLLLYAGRMVSMSYYFGLLGLAMPAYFAWRTHKRIRFCGLLNELRAGWGIEKGRDRNIPELRRLFKYFRFNSTTVHVLNDQTWDDLDMVHTYAKIDRTLTTPGEQVLYNILRTPLLSEVAFLQRKKVINFMQYNQEPREKIQVSLSLLGRQRINLVTDLLWGDVLHASRIGFPAKLMFAAALACLGSVYFLGLDALAIVVLPVFIINYFLYNAAMKDYAGQLPTLRYLSSLICTAQEIGALRTPVLRDYCLRLNKSAAYCTDLLKKTRMLGLGEVDQIGIYVYVNIFFLIDARTFGAALQDINNLRNELQEIYQLIGELDALISVASFRAGLPCYAEPELLKAESFLEGRNLKHPVLDNPVPNSLSLNKTGAIVTGSNMSGKSTFLRTVGVNALLAQSICACFASSYTGSYFKIMTSISKSDSLTEGKSYYLAEAESLLEMINSLDERVPSLLLIDEIFRGTNSLERVNAAVEFLKYMQRCNAITIVASHDLEIAKSFAGSYQLFYFSEAVGKTGLEFDYTLKKGVAHTWNAIRLLEYLGYPQQIVKGATKRIEAITRQME